MLRVAIVTLGCPKNDIDSEGLGGMLAAAGHAVTTDPSAADVVLLNTCGFIDAARKETVDEVLSLAELKSEGSCRGLVMTGCLVARAAPALVDALPEVDAFVDFAAYPRIADIVREVDAGTLEQKVHGDPGTRFDPAWWDASMAAAPRIRFGRAPWAYLKIAEGCDRGCTFCAIPLMRGKFVSRPRDVILHEARRLVDGGVVELSLVSQDSVMWGRDTGDGDLGSLLGELERVDGLRRIRLMYLHPQGVTDALIDRIVSSEIVASYFDLSLQHVAPAVLRGMGRWGGAERFETMIGSIRDRDPLAGIRATFILGFPGETDGAAAQVESFVGTADLDWIGVFTYSREEGTRSATRDDHIPAALSRERADRVRAAGEITMSARAASLGGSELEVLAERLDVATDRWTGRSHREAPEVDGDITFTSDRPLRVGDFVRVRVTGSDGSDLIGRLAS